MDQKLLGSPITGDYLSKCLNESLGSHAILKSVEGHRIGEGQGFASNILRLKLNWETPGNLPTSVVVKVPGAESLQALMGPSESVTDEQEKLRLIMAQTVPILHNTECYFYNMFGGVPPIQVPECYAAVPVTLAGPGMIILEDLSDKAAVNQEITKGLTYQQTMEAAIALARLQAWSLKTSLNWRSKVAGLKDREKMVRGYLSTSPAGFQMVKEKYPDEFGSIDIELLKALSKYEAYEAIMKEHSEFMDDVLCHGDLHINNLMYAKDENGKVGGRLAAMIDFQALMKGCPMYDLAHLFTFSVSHNLRRQHQNDFLRRYYDEIKLMAGEKLTATFDQIQGLFERQFAIGAILMVSWIPIIQTILVKSEGDQKEEENRMVVEMIKANYDDAMEIFCL